MSLQTCQSLISTCAHSSSHTTKHVQYLQKVAIDLLKAISQEQK